MNCHDFHQRLQQQLDERQCPEHDRQLLAHARQCDRCHAQLELWRKLSAVMAAPVSPVSLAGPTLRRRRAGWAVIGSIAATLLFMALRQPPSTRPASSDLATTQRVTEPRVDRSRILAQRQADVDPADWWRQVQPGDWVSQTMPTVRSMQEGVAPLGRTLMRAVTLLTLGGRDQTS